ncbi:uncharacterized protein KQ657_003636 [Scheffersomyces spartinae]|uniref:Plus3 domain-containing protein n=1 Tax=Scheffersomyces spartinae TaxID=45513 RepID=A0A9P7VCC5_9ASCO|nr:uncharacterized protein KQ657_003636 [Scheffersomyces spartinae]KAG7195115.1 hypothetical protein KQ657_003636 [Scheffersomyces spartinae]
MSDLDDDLLALAGGADSDYDSSPEPDVTSKKRRITDFEDDDDEGEDGNAENADDEFEQEEIVNPYPLEGKYKDASDRDRLEAMDELTKERILFDRGQEMEKYNERKYLLERMKELKRGLAQKSSSVVSAKSRSKAVNTKEDKLSELRKQRQKRQKKSTDSYDEDEDDDEESDDNLEDDFDDDGYDEEGEVEWGGVLSTQRGISGARKRSTVRATVTDINTIAVGRTVLSKHFYVSDFTDLVIDCYGKINVGMDNRTRQPLYRLVKIMDVVSRPEKSYVLPAGSKCDIYLKVSQNSRQVREFPLGMFSDSPVTNDEFDRYVKELQKADEEIEYVDDVNDKFEQLSHMINRGISDNDVNEMLVRKQKQKAQDLNSLSGYDAVFEKTKLRDQLKIAEQENDFVRVKDLQTRLSKLDQVIVEKTKDKDGSSKTYDSMQKVNERNRKLNLANIRKAEIKNQIQRKSVEQSNDDPFLRLKTVTRIFYQEITEQENQRALADAHKNFLKDLEDRTKNEEKLAASTYRVLGKIDEVIRTIDIDLQI